MTPEQLTAILMQKLQEDAASLAAEYGPMSLWFGTAAIGAAGLIWGASKLFCRSKPAQVIDLVEAHEDALVGAVQNSVQVALGQNLAVYQAPANIVRFSDRANHYIDCDRSSPQAMFPENVTPLDRMIANGTAKFSI